LAYSKCIFYIFLYLCKPKKIENFLSQVGFMIKPTRMIAELMNAKERVASFEHAIEMATRINNDVAIDMRFGVLPKLTEKVEKMQRAIDDLVKTHHILFEELSYEKACIILNRHGKTIVKNYDLHDFKDNQDWTLTRSKERFEKGHESDNEGYYWAIVRCDCHWDRLDVERIWMPFALTPTEGNSLFKQLNEWHRERVDRVADSPNYIYFPEPNSCHACSTPVMQVYEKSIGSDIYQYCCQECAEVDFTTCSTCGETEVSKKDCAQNSGGCCQQYLGGNLQYYCSERCKGEDTDEFIRSFH
jgi:hypothetical protein